MISVKWYSISFIKGSFYQIIKSSESDKLRSHVSMEEKFSILPKWSKSMIVDAPFLMILKINMSHLRKIHLSFKKNWIIFRIMYNLYHPVLKPYSTTRSSAQIRRSGCDLSHIALLKLWIRELPMFLFYASSQLVIGKSRSGIVLAFAYLLQ